MVFLILNQMNYGGCFSGYCIRAAIPNIFPMVIIITLLIIFLKGKFNSDSAKEDIKPHKVMPKENNKPVRNERHKSVNNRSYGSTKLSSTPESDSIYYREGNFIPASVVKSSNEVIKKEQHGSLHKDPSKNVKFSSTPESNSVYYREGNFIPDREGSTVNEKNQSNLYRSNINYHSLESSLNLDKSEKKESVEPSRYKPASLGLTHREVRKSANSGISSKSISKKPSVSSRKKRKISNDGDYESIEEAYLDSFFLDESDLSLSTTSNEFRLSQNEINKSDPVTFEKEDMPLHGGIQQRENDALKSDRVYSDLNYRSSEPDEHNYNDLSINVRSFKTFSEASTAAKLASERCNTVVRFRREADVFMVYFPTPESAKEAIDTATETDSQLITDELDLVSSDFEPYQENEVTGYCDFEAERNHLITEIYDDAESLYRSNEDGWYYSDFDDE
mgnify:FL=1